MKVDLVVNQLIEGLDPSISAVCEQMIIKLSEIPPRQLERITVAWLADIAHLKWNDRIMQSALAAMTSVRHHPLVLYFIMYDSITKHEIAFEVEEVSRSLESGELIHPHTGFAIPNFTEQLKPVYRINPQFEELINANG